MSTETETPATDEDGTKRVPLTNGVATVREINLTAEAARLKSAGGPLLVQEKAWWFKFATADGPLEGQFIATRMSASAHSRYGLTRARLNGDNAQSLPNDVFMLNEYIAYTTAALREAPPWFAPDKLLMPDAEEIYACVYKEVVDWHTSFRRRA